jgi:hypothetical protein
VAGGSARDELLKQGATTPRPWFFRAPEAGGNDDNVDDDDEDEDEDFFRTAYSNNSHWCGRLFPAGGRSGGPSAHVAYYDAASLYPSSGKPQGQRRRQSSPATPAPRLPRLPGSPGSLATPWGGRGAPAARPLPRATVSRARLPGSRGNPESPRAHAHSCC